MSNPILTLHVEAYNFKQLVDSTLRALGHNDTSIQPIRHLVSDPEKARAFKDMSPDSVGAKIVEGLKDAIAHAQDLPSSVAIDVVAEQERVAAMAEAAFPPKPRGRPRKNAQPAVAENTGSPAATTLPVPPPAAVVAEQASTAAVVDSPASAVTSTTAPSIPFTAEQVRAKLQEFLVTPGGDRGLQLAGDVLAQFGLAKVKQVNDNPQHFAGIVAAVDAELAKLAVSK